ncbi:MAG: glycerate kinase [Victivallales bacterium]|nr:glycerate kinase [Victivallales bacterium]
MKIIIAPDSFKGCLRSTAVAAAVKRGLAEMLPDAEIRTMPLADGGEGTVAALVSATGGSYLQVPVRGPLGDPVEAVYGRIDAETAVMEMAAAAGLELVESHRLNPGRTSTYGVGQMIADAIRRGFRHLVIGIGGSATVDGGAGMAQALGFVLRDAAGKPIAEPASGGMLEKITAIEAGPDTALLRQVDIRVACDVTNPLTGPRGAAPVYGPQKGADPAMVQQLAAGLENFSRLAIAADLADDNCHPGDGAAGGLGFALRTLCGAEIVSGARLVIETAQLEKQLQDADWVITGEGCTDDQTAAGKLCAVVAATAAAYRVPTIVLSGAVKGSVAKLQHDFAAVMSIAAGPGSLAEAIAAAPERLYAAGRNLGGILQQQQKSR